MADRRVKYIADAGPFSEVSITGKQQSWRLNDVAFVPAEDSELLINSGKFVLAFSSINPDNNEEKDYANQQSSVESSARPVLMGFGCSISQMDQPIQSTTTTTVVSEAKAGATTLTVASGASLSNGDKVAISLYDGRIWKTTVTVSGNVLTPASATPRLIRASAIVAKYTSPMAPDTSQPINITRGAVQLLGGGVEVVTGYGYGGALCGQMVQDFIAWFNYYRPSICVFSLFENDFTGLANGISTLAQIKGMARFVCRYCLQNGCTPVIYSSIPYNLVQTSRCSDYDEMARWVVSDLPIEIPGSKGANVSTQWLDTSVTTTRGPLAGWTDGVHPNIDHRFAVAKLAGVPALQSIVPASKSLLDYCQTPRGLTNLEGSGGTSGSMAGGSVIPASWTCSNFGSVATMTTSRNADGSLKFLCTWPISVARDRSTDYGYFRYSYTFPAAWAGSGAYFRGYLRAKILQNSGISQFQCSVVVASGETYYGDTGVGGALSLPTSNDIICIETPEFTLGGTQTSLTIGVTLKPVTDAAPAAAAVFEFDLYELGLLPATAPFPIV